MDIQMIRTIEHFYLNGVEIEPTNDERLMWQLYGLPEGVTKRWTETQVVPTIKVRTKKDWEKMFDRIVLYNQPIDKVVITNF